jgi:hypothetical protein
VEGSHSGRWWAGSRGRRWRSLRAHENEGGADEGSLHGGGRWRLKGRGGGEEEKGEGSSGLRHVEGKGKVGQYRQWRGNSGRGRRSGSATEVRMKGGSGWRGGGGCVGCHGQAGVSRLESTLKFSIYSK